MSRPTEIPEPLAEFPVIISLPVLWGNMDALGHVNNTVPIRWFECGRVALLEEAGLMGLMTGEKLGPILAAVHCDYRRQILYPDQVLVASRAGRRGRTSLQIEHRIFSQRAGQVACSGESVVVVFDYQRQRPVRIPESMMAALDRLHSRVAPVISDPKAAEESVILEVRGLVERAGDFSYAELSAIDASDQIEDVSGVVPGRVGSAVRLRALLARTGVHPSARYLGLHADADDFHASIPLDAVLDSGLVVYRLAGGQLPAEKGGPIRFLIPDPAACHTSEVDECANVKFISRLELTSSRGYDNRPEDEKQHAALHGKAQ